MGQSSSRSQRSAPQDATTSSTSSPRGAAAEPSTSSPQPGPSTPPPSSQSRSSLRKKVVSMIRPSSQREREDTGGERSRRRLSKSPAQPQVVEDAQQSEASSSHRPPSLALSNDKGKNRADVEELPEEPRPDTPPPPIATASSPPPALAPVSAPAPLLTPAPAPEPLARHPNPETQDLLSRWRSEAPGSSDEEDNVPSRANLNRNPVSPAPPQTNAAPRQFPPPGTLVVVQGIVHTADVSRPPSDRPSTGTEARGGAFTRSSPPSSFGRSSTDSSPPTASETLPSSDTGSRSSGISPGSVDVLGTLLSVAAAATAASLLTGSSEPILSSGLAPPGSGTSSTNPGSPIAGDRPTATPGTEQDATFAASRAERMRQAWGTIRERLGLRPTPSPRASLGGLGPNGFGAGSGLGGLGTGSGVTDTRELMLEEMARAFNIGLGLNGFGATTSTGGSTTTSTSPDGDVRARGTVPVDDDINDENAGSGTLPAEGSFDRFLVDLQSDLRVALTGDGEEEGSAERRQPEQEATGAPIASSSTEAASTSQPPPPSTAPPPLPTPAIPPMNAAPSAVPAVDGEDSTDDSDDDMPALESIHDSESVTREIESTGNGDHPAQMNEEERRQVLEAAVRELGMAAQNPEPPSGEVDGDATPRASSPSMINDQTRNAQHASTSTSTESTGAPTSGPSSSTGSRNGRMDESGRINWWRLYRFPAINSTAPSPSTSPGTTSPTSTSPFTTTATTSESSNPSTSTDEASRGQGSQQPAAPLQSPQPTLASNAPAPTPATAPFLPNFLPPPAGQTVVPVIVVGLQSVAPGQFGFDVMPAAHTHTHDHFHNHNRTSPPVHPFPMPASGLGRTRQEELAVLEDLLREAEAEAEADADARLYDRLEHLAREVSGDTTGEQERRDPWDRLMGNQNQSQSPSQNRSRGHRVTVEEVEDEDADGPSRPRLRRDVDEMIAEDEALDLEDADDDESEDEKEEEEVEDEEEDEEGPDDYYRRADRNARARALARAEAKKEAKREAKEEKKRKKEMREQTRQARAARLAAAADARRNAAARASTSAGAGGSGSRNGYGYGPRPFGSASSPIGSERERGAPGSTALSRYAEQLRDLANQMRDEGRAGRHPSPGSPFGSGIAPLRPSAPGVGAGGLGVGMTMGGMSGGAGAGMGMGLPGGAGSRTFLIYVIGGYYPPDHTIVTGGPESFQSFEALLELAEMLGHAKPPTVTKEEIDKSGLETIKPAQLAAYEEAGKISSNCTERCLICLDDYEPEDDVRVMSCRHAFHQSCVDTWLQTGRNNCPACRSTGVNAAEASPTLA